jgi:radical SAM protein with 4Fe4S-binding SPASM domain
MKGPTKVGLFVTSRCNQKCTYCATESNRSLRAPDMTPGLLRQVLDTFPTIRRAGIGGGEPLACKHIGRLVDIAHRRLDAVGISTNGTLVMRTELDWSKVLGINISMSEVTDERYRAVTGTNLLPEVCSAIDHLLSQDRQPTLSFVIDKSNVSRIGAYGKFAQNMGVSKVAFQSACPRSDQYEMFPQVALYADDTETQRVVSEQLLYVGNLEGVRVVQWPRPLRRGPGQGCAMARRYLAVDGRGDMAICCRGPGPRREMGNISGGLEAWSGGAMGELRARVYDAKNKPEKCLLCKANWSVRR